MKAFPLDKVANCPFRALKENVVNWKIMQKKVQIHYASRLAVLFFFLANFMAFNGIYFFFFEIQGDDWMNRMPQFAVC